MQLESENPARQHTPMPHEHQSVSKLLLEKNRSLQGVTRPSMFDLNRKPGPKASRGERQMNAPRRQVKDFTLSNDKDGNPILRLKYKSDHGDRVVYFRLTPEQLAGLRENAGEVLEKRRAFRSQKRPPVVRQIVQGGLPS